MRLQGFSIEEISTALGCSARTVLRDLDTTRQLYTEFDLNDYEMWRQLELARLEALEVRNNILLQSNDVRILSTGIQNALSISEARRRLLGLDAPKRRLDQVEANGEVVIRIVEGSDHESDEQ
ncbi:MAG: hypothetical protein KatS3mg038_1016 [Candidatus Kapaibacterium sp.]|nr:MAG: hypothetical protein KatS3mg038_1016 [Candidatus Kapabacteria bacterium]